VLSVVDDLYVAAVYLRMFSFVETKLFTRLVQEYLSDDEYSVRSGC
jgi:hypothetical protein